MKKSILLSIIIVMIAILGKAQECTLPANLQNGLVGYWPFNGNTFDESANGNNGTNNGVDFGEDRFGNLNSAGVFDGNDYVLVENAIDQINTSSVCGWFNSAAIQGAAFVQFGNDNPNTGCTGMSIGQGEGDFIGDGNNLHAALNCTTGWVTGHFELPPPGTWTHFAMVKAPGRLSLFINGVLVAYRIVGEPTFDLQTIFFGASSASLDYTFQGLLDDIYIYDRNLTEAEVAELYSSNSGLTARIITDGRNTLPVGSPVTLTTNEGTYTYQWYINGNTIDGATQVNYNPITSGSYTVSISNGVCSTTSLPVVITFTVNPIMCELPQSSFSNGVIGFWPFCGTYHDLGPNMQNTKSSGATLTTDRYGTPNAAYHFNGSTDFMIVEDALSNLDTISLVGWYKSDFIQGGAFAYVGVNSPVYGCDGIGIGQGEGDYITDGNNLHTDFGCSGGWLGPGIPLPDPGSWNQFGFSKAGDDYRIYLNGQLIQSYQLNTPSLPTNWIFFGAASPGGDYAFSGSLDDLIVFDRALSAEEVALLYGDLTLPVAGCTDNTACNFLASATADDGSCQFPGSPCDDANASTINDIIDASCGCTGTPIELGIEHTCGASLVHNPNLTYGSMTDQEGNVYKTIVIGDQEWMAENLNTSIYRNGDAIPTGYDFNTWGGTTSGSWSYYNDNANGECPFGKLYNWYTVADSRQLCPSGWHVPTEEEWNSLIEYLGGYSVAGGKMKSTGNIDLTTGLWYSPNGGATNSSGFSGLPGGDRNGGGAYYDLGLGVWWTSTTLDDINAYSKILNYTDGALQPSLNNYHYGFSVRCMNDEAVGLIPGCTDLLACNYNSSATEDDGSCQFPGSPCDDANASTINDIIDESCGCTGTPIELGVEHTCGAPLVHNPNLTYGNMTDQEGNIYKTIVIGEQEWMAENLNTSIYRNGDAIVTGLDNVSWGSTTSGAWAVFENDNNFECPNGKLYNWYTTIDPRQLCPTGWHIPNVNEWNTLIQFSGGSSIAGGNLKTVGTNFWVTPNADASNSSGFSGLPGGYKASDGLYYGYGYGGSYWSSEQNDAFNATYFSLLNYEATANGNSFLKNSGYSIRCIRDANTGLIPGCTNMFACNYNPDATEEDGSCLYPGDTCEDLNPLTENDLLDELCECAGTPIVVNCPTLDPALQNGLVGYWPFCGNANDESGNENNGVVNGATLTEDRFGNAGSAYFFNDSYIKVNHNTSLNAFPISVFAWCKSSTLSQTTEGIISKYPFMSSNGWSLHADLGNISGYYYNGSGSEMNFDGISQPPAILDEAWHFIGMVADSLGASLYIDGVHEASISGWGNETPSACTTTGNVHFGSFSDALASSFIGLIDDIGIWNRALTAEEVALLYGNFTQTIPGCTDPSAFNYNPQANQNEGCLYTASVFVYNDLNGNGEHESNEPGLANWPVVGNDINGLLWTNGNGNAFVAVPSGAYQFTVLNTTDNWVLTTEASGILSVGGNNCTDQNGNPVTCPSTTLSFGLQVIPGEAIVAAGPFTGFWDILHCTDGYESGVYLENIGSQTVSGFMTLTCDPLFTPNASSYFTTPPAETGPGYALWNIEDFLPGEYELLSYFVPGPGVEYLNAVFNFSLELTLLDPQGNIIYDETWDASPIVACAYDPNDLIGRPEGLPQQHEEGYTQQHFILDEHLVQFQARFQNTGTLPAEDVKVVILIDTTEWDISTIHPLHRTAEAQINCLHDDATLFSIYNLVLPSGVDLTDKIVLVYDFQDINLPDSASDSYGSNGSLTFAIRAKDTLNEGDELYAQAFIYFDSNPPITTNETYHVIFDCNSFTPMVGQSIYCEDEMMSFTATQPYVDSYMWALNNTDVGTGEQFSYPATLGNSDDGSVEYLLELITSNALCPLDIYGTEAEVHQVVGVINPTPSLNQNTSDTFCAGEEVLFDAQSNGTVYWSNGVANGSNITATESFVADVFALSNAGCSSAALSWEVTVNPLPSAEVDTNNNVLTAVDGIAWQWLINGDEDVTTQSITASVSGNYQVKITNEFGCEATSDLFVITDVSFVHSWSTLHLYPNPMTTGARLELPQGTFDVALYDITGACIRTLSKQQGTVVIERESLASGVYQLQVSQGEVMKSVRLVVE